MNPYIIKISKSKVEADSGGSTPINPFFKHCILNQDILIEQSTTTVVYTWKRKATKTSSNFQQYVHPLSPNLDPPLQCTWKQFLSYCL